VTLEEEAKALAEYRLANYRGHNDTKHIGDPFDIEFKGFIGEVAFGRCFGFAREHLWNIGTDGGSDYCFTVDGSRYTVDVKTAGAPYGLIVPPRRQPADIYLLAHYIHDKFAFVGWATGVQVMNAPMRKYRSGMCHRIAVDDLQPMSTLCDWLARRDR
jgi:hypothetical protein